MIDDFELVQGKNRVLVEMRLPIPPSPVPPNLHRKLDEGTQSVRLRRPCTHEIRVASNWDRRAVVI